MFGMGFTEILIIAVMAILFLGPDKLPGAMVDIAKFFRDVKNTIGGLKSTLEEEMNVTEIKEEALAYKKELLGAQDSLENMTKIPQTTTQPKSVEVDEQMLKDIDAKIAKTKEANSNTADTEVVTFKKKKNT